MRIYPQGQKPPADTRLPWQEYWDFLALAKSEGIEGEEPAMGSQHESLPPPMGPKWLDYAGKVAWRNSNRCIGRLFWKNLMVRDSRGIDSAEEYFESILEHLRLATNGGKIRPVLTVFSPVDSEGRCPRILNHQLIRYAGYKDKDGVVLGDPQNIKLTEAAISAGWKCPRNRGPFDILPVAIQLPGKPARWFEIPSTDILEVRLRHPEFPWFEKLGLRWYAVPVITDMCFDAAGRKYSCAPFNGWYMGTEIGARNLADPQRYNLLPIVAEKMGLNIKRPSNLWKDRALVELNTAVLHSFEKDGATIVDHHNASSQFMQFAANEKRCGREITGDWSWLIPPISASACPVFHRAFDHTVKKPVFTYQ